MPHRKPPVSKSKAHLILSEGRIRGKRLTQKQKGFFGAVLSGKFGHKKRK